MALAIGIAIFTVIRTRETVKSLFVSVIVGRTVDCALEHKIEVVTWSTCDAIIF